MAAKSRLPVRTKTVERSRRTVPTLSVQLYVHRGISYVFKFSFFLVLKNSTQCLQNVNVYYICIMQNVFKLLHHPSMFVTSLQQKNTFYSQPCLIFTARLPPAGAPCRTEDQTSESAPCCRCPYPHRFIPNPSTFKPLALLIPS